MISQDISKKQIIGSVEKVSLPDLGIANIPSRIDTGAGLSAIWASDIREVADKLHFKLFDKGHPLFTGESIIYDKFETRQVRSSNGTQEERYMVRIAVRLGGRRVLARFTLANRSTQKYPVLIGRNILRGKFIVDTKHQYIVSN